MLTSNEKVTERYIYSCQVTYSVSYSLRSGEHEVLNYIQLNLNKINIAHMMYVTFTAVAQVAYEGYFFIDSLKIKSET